MKRMAKMVSLNGRGWGIQYNDGSYMRCFNGEIWCHTKAMILEVLPTIQDHTIAKEENRPTHKPHSGGKGGHANWARAIRASRRGMKNCRRDGKSHY